MAKQLFTVIIFTGDSTTGRNGFIKYRNVNNINKFKKFACEKFPRWRFATVYDKISRRKLELIKPDNPLQGDGLF